jgi:hypothetical protein
MAITTIQNKVKVYNPYALYVTPWTSETTKGGATYKLDEVIRDSTTISQDDPEETKIENEFGSAPIINTITLGSYQFSTEVTEMSPELLKVLCGFSVDTENEKAYAPSNYNALYAEISLVFAATGGKYIAAILPKVQLNSKATLDSLSSNMGRITLAGTGLNATVDGKTTPFVLDTNFELPA